MRKLGDDKADVRVVGWVSGRDAASFYISALTLMELEIGILLIEFRDVAQGERLRTWMDRYVVPEFAERTLPVDSAVALKCVPLHVSDPRAERDALIAATAIVHGMTVVTRNVADFERQVRQWPIHGPEHDDGEKAGHCRRADRPRLVSGARRRG